MLNKLVQELLSVYPDVNQANQVAIWLLEKLTGQSHAQILLDPVINLTKDQQALLASWVKQITVEHKPVQYILGSVPFLNLDILVQAPVLIPRPETEWWVDLLITRLARFKNEPLKILDLCSGSGCIGLALAKYFVNAQVIAVDISQAACELIAKNKLHNQITNLQIIQADLFADLANEKFDLIVSNPPYIPQSDYQNLDLSVRLWEDRLALVAPDFDLAIIVKIITLAPSFLQNKYASLPQLWLEIDATQGEQVRQLMQNSFDHVELIVDQFNRQRVIVGR